MNKIILSLFIVFLSLLLVSCSGQEGTAEKAGKEIDKSIDSGKQTIDEVLEEASDKMDEIESSFEGPAEQAGKEIDQAVENTAEKIEEVGDTLEENAEEAGDTLEEKIDGSK
ncbi:hypothetical protein [Nitrosomonas supralitoralis]|uniref:Uncharacterized protein n=1 Tax=Nitrosomonas supralitoralis TaxID=2116706 RepID=A0A2P7NXM4_9PROT|nr:hypothetical protein [Nitrosomonas supralitoralis]PSJ18195.1 hypothetical protein C7H79_04030 [Nitrosomonas supralitoralis]